ncbi:hypothetical protein L6452_32440 [Arctium lappa]|uniref:Uncharacterized protein n=1 Tax=Arctium lappa TaxID=4217 RepID=A0ACB8Z8X0_ARCLA|nr:hypothetical protein L6452_32440 [Arctium lappa]
MNPVPKSITVDISELSPITETTSLPRGSATGGEEEEVAPFLHEARSQIHHRRHIGTFADHRDDVFSQLGVPIKTTIPANVLEEALNGTVTVRPLPIGTSASGKNPNTIVRCLPHPAVISLSVVYRQFQFLLSDLASLIVF